MATSKDNTKPMLSREMSDRLHKGLDVILRSIATINVSPSTERTVAGMISRTPDFTGRIAPRDRMKDLIETLRRPIDLYDRVPPKIILRKRQVIGDCIKATNELRVLAVRDGEDYGLGMFVTLLEDALMEAARHDKTGASVTSGCQSSISTPQPTVSRGLITELRAAKDQCLTEMTRLTPSYPLLQLENLTYWLNQLLRGIDPDTDVPLSVIDDKGEALSLCIDLLNSIEVVWHISYPTSPPSWAVPFTRLLNALLAIRSEAWKIKVGLAQK